MKTENAKSSAFLKTIDDASREQKSAVIAQTEEYKAKRLLEAKEEAQRKYNEYIEEQSRILELEFGTNTQKRDSILKKEIIDARMRITQDVFGAVEKKLVSFTQTPEYKDFLIKSAKKISDLCGSFPITVFLRGRDMQFSEDIKAVFGNISVEADDSIKIGGIYGVCAAKSVKLDDLLETRLEEQKEWFYENSGLSLSH